MSPQTRETNAKMNYGDYRKSQNFCTIKDATNKTKRRYTKWEKVLANDIFDKGLGSKIYKEFVQLNTQKKNTDNLTKNGEKA